MDTTTSTEQRKGQVDETPLSPIEDAKVPLEKLLGQRPTQKELVDHNILKDPKIAPSLHAAQQELQRRQLEDKLSGALAQRPTADELVKEGILNKEEAPDTSIPAEKVVPPSIS